jgi:hypothetical protein
MAAVNKIEGTGCHKKGSCITVPQCFGERKKNMGRDHLEELIERARKIEMTPSQEAAQRQSFAYGNTHIENERITRQMVAEADKKLQHGG